MSTVVVSVGVSHAGGCSPPLVLQAATSGITAITAESRRTRRIGGKPSDACRSMTT
jgi:hypothetical protein